MGDIRLSFRGQEYLIPDDRVFEAGEAVEDVADLFEVDRWRRRPHFHKMSRALAALLGVAGLRVTPREVKVELMQGVTDGNPAAHYEALGALMAALMDGAPAADKKDGEQPEKPPAAS